MKLKLVHDGLGLFTQVPTLSLSLTGGFEIIALKYVLTLSKILQTKDLSDIKTALYLTPRVRLSGCIPMAVLLGVLVAVFLGGPSRCPNGCPFGVPPYGCLQGFPHGVLWVSFTVAKKYGCRNWSCNTCPRAPLELRQNLNWFTRASISD